MLTFFLAFFIFSGFRKGREGFSRSSSIVVLFPHSTNGKKATVVSYNLVDGLYILQIEGESSASLLGYKKTKSWVIH